MIWSLTDFRLKEVSTVIEPVSGAAVTATEKMASGRPVEKFAIVLERQGTQENVATENKTLHGSLDGFITRIEDGQRKVDEIIALALSGRSFSPQELLALQAQAYMFSQELELTGKVVEKATSGIKETMRTNV